jgi:hypothetical protein
MQCSWSVPTAALAFLLASQPAEACITYAPLDLKDVKYADVVLVGSVSNYRIIRDPKFRKKMLSNPKLPPNMRKLYKGQNSLLSDYARFDIEVHEVLAGKAPTKLSVTWDNSTFGEPEKIPPGPFLVALRKPSSKIPPLRGASATILPTPDPHSLTLLQAPCSSPLMFESRSGEARTIRRLLARRP